MGKPNSLLQSAFAHMYFLMLSADKIADMNELDLGNKIIRLENFDKSEVMKELDRMSAVPRGEVYQDAINILKSVSPEEQLKALAYAKMIGKVDGSLDETESDLLYQIGANELNIKLPDIAKKEEILKLKIPQ